MTKSVTKRSYKLEQYHAMTTVKHSIITKINAEAAEQQ